MMTLVNQGLFTKRVYSFIKRYYESGSVIQNEYLTSYLFPLSPKFFFSFFNIVIQSHDSLISGVIKMKEILFS